MDNPSFDGYRGTLDVLNIVAECEISLVVRLLTNAATMSREPAHYWTEFKEVFYRVFLPCDDMTELEGEPSDLVQALTQRLLSS